MMEHRRIPCRVFSRIVGYLTSVDSWHAGKRQEFSERKPFRVWDGVAIKEDGDDHMA